MNAERRRRGLDLEPVAAQGNDLLSVTLEAASSQASERAAGALLPWQQGSSIACAPINSRARQQPGERPSATWHAGC